MILADCTALDMACCAATMSYDPRVTTGVRYERDTVRARPQEARAVVFYPAKQGRPQSRRQGLPRGSGVIFRKTAGEVGWFLDALLVMVCRMPSPIYLALC